MDEKLRSGVFKAKQRRYIKARFRLPLIIDISESINYRTNKTSAISRTDFGQTGPVIDRAINFQKEEGLFSRL